MRLWSFRWVETPSVIEFEKFKTKIMEHKRIVGEIRKFETTVLSISDESRTFCYFQPFPVVMGTTVIAVIIFNNYQSN